LGESFKLLVSPNGNTKKHLLWHIKTNRANPQRAREAAARLLTRLNDSIKRGPKTVDPSPVVTEKASVPAPPVGTVSGDVHCNCIAGRKISGLKWHSPSTPGCINNTPKPPNVYREAITEMIDKIDDHLAKTANGAATKAYFDNLTPKAAAEENFMAQSQADGHAEDRFHDEGNPNHKQEGA